MGEGVELLFAVFMQKSVENKEQNKIRSFTKHYSGKDVAKPYFRAQIKVPIYFLLLNRDKKIQEYFPDNSFMLKQ